MRNDDRYTVALRPIATPLPLTFCGLLIASVIMSGEELGWIPLAQQHAAGWALLAVPFPLQILAACWGFVARSAAGATGSAVLAAAWLSIALDLINVPPDGPGPSNAVGMMTFAAGAALLVPVLAELRVGGVLPAAVLATAALRFFFTGVSGMTHSLAWQHTSGWMGIAVAATALYGALALELEGTTQQALLPTFRRSVAATAVVAGLEAQLEQLEHEPGVRKVL